jgi:predicted PurR-regulated permease PerM
MTAGGRSVAVTLEPRHLYKAVGLFFLLLFLYRFFGEIANLLLLTYAAAILAVALNPLVQRFSLNRTWLAVGVGLLVFGSLGGAAWLLVPVLASQLRSFVDGLPEFERQFEEWGEWLREQTGLDIGMVGDQTAEAFTSIVQGVGVEAIFGQAFGLIEAIAIPFLILVGGLYALARPNKGLLNPILRVAGEERREDYRRMLGLLGKRLRGWVWGTLLRMVAVGILSTIAFWVIGLPNFILLGTVAGLADFIPVVGPFLGAIPAVLVALMDDPIKAVWVMLAILAIQQLESNVISPWAMSTAAHIHPFVTLFTLILFGSIFGFLGVLMALPIVILLWTVVEVLWVERALKDDPEASMEPVVEE